MSPSAVVGFVLARFDGAGNHLWSKGYGQASLGTGLSSAAFDPSGAIVISGGFKGTLDLGAGPMTDTASGPINFVAKLSPTGNLIRAQSGVGGGMFAIDAEGHIAVASSDGITLLAP